LISRIFVNISKILKNGDLRDEINIKKLGKQMAKF